MEEVLFYCKWRNKPQMCLKFFTQVWTDEGLCFTFNLQHSDNIYTSRLVRKLLKKKIVDFDKFFSIFAFSWTLRMAPEPRLLDNNTDTDTLESYWSLENGYNNRPKYSTGGSVYPYRSYGAGLRGGFTTLLRLYDYDTEYMCRGPVQGFKVLLHLPNEFPQISSHFFRVPMNKDVQVTVSPKVTTTAHSLKYLTPETRGCFYNSERSLKYFKEYTQRNCELECLANVTLSKCGCVKFSMPRKDSTTWNIFLYFFFLA